MRPDALQQGTAMPDYHEELDRRAAALRHLRGAELLDAVEGIVALCEEHADADAAIAWRVDLLRLASDLDATERELKAFDALRRTYQSDPAYADLRAQVLWYYKWIMERLPEFAEVPAAVIDRMFEEMQKFYEQEGEGLRPVHMLRCQAAAAMGRADEADRLAARWESVEADDSDDCPACETHSRVQYLLDVGRVPEALAAAGPVLEGGQSCAEVPAVTFSRLLIPVALTGDADLAEQMRLFVRRGVRKVPKLFGHLADHVLYLTVTGRPAEAVRPATVALSRAVGSGNTQKRFEAFRAGWACFARLAMLGNERVRLPRHFPPTGEDGYATPADAAAWCGEQAASAAEALDARNGTDRFSQRLRNLHDLFASIGEPE